MTQPYTRSQTNFEDSKLHVLLYKQYMILEYMESDQIWKTGLRRNYDIKNAQKFYTKSCLLLS